MQNNTKRYTFEELLNEQGYFVYTNVGTSMMPLLREQRDLIEIRRKERPVKKYDVALYRSGDKYILHRCVKVLPDGRYIFAGDNNDYKEYDVTDDMILGIMASVLRNGKRIMVDTLSFRIYSHLCVSLFPIKVFFRKASRLFRRLRRLSFRKLKVYLKRRLIRAINKLRTL